MDRAFVDKLWAEHLLKRKSISRIVTEALAAHFHVDPATLWVDEAWKPLGAVPEKPGSKETPA